MLGGNAVAVHEGILEAEIVGAQDEGGLTSADNLDVGAQVEDALRGGVEGEFMGSDPVCSFPGRLPGVHHAGFEPGLQGVLGAVLVPGGYFDTIGGFGLEGDAAVGDVVRAAVRDLAAVPEQAAIAFAFHFDPVRRLAGAAYVGFHFPTEDWVAVFDGEGFVGVLDAQVGDAGLGWGGQQAGHH